MSEKSVPTKVRVLLFVLLSLITGGCSPDATQAIAPVQPTVPAPQGGDDADDLSKLVTDLVKATTRDGCIKGQQKRFAQQGLDWDGEVDRAMVAIYPHIKVIEDRVPNGEQVVKTIATYYGVAYGAGRKGQSYEDLDQKGIIDMMIKHAIETAR